MKAVDPNIKIIANWNNELSEPNYWNQWEYLIETAGPNFDYADVHWYWDWGRADWDVWLGQNPMEVREWCADCSGPDNRYHGPSYFQEIINFYNNVNDVNSQSYDIGLVALEWNVAPVYDREFSKFQQAMLQSEMLGQFIKGGLHLATIWPTDWVGELDWNFRTILDQEKKQPTPTYYVFKLYSNALGQQLVSSSSGQDNIYVVSALSQASTTLWVYLINKTATPTTAQVDIGNFSPTSAEAITLAADDVESDVAGLKELTNSYNSETGKWECIVPDYSLTMLTFQGEPPPLPGQATNPSPANGANDVSVDANLSWTAGENATSHDVYFGTASPGTFQTNQPGTTFEPGTMDSNTPYYWRIDEKNITGTTTGVVWSFTTEAAPEVYVYDIAMDYKKAGPNRNGIATVWIKDTNDANVVGATVYGDWSGLVEESDEGDTGEDGKVLLESSTIKSAGTFTFCVSNVTAEGYIYNESLNNETCDDVNAP